MIILFKIPYSAVKQSKTLNKLNACLNLPNGEEIGTVKFQSIGGARRKLISFVFMPFLNFHSLVNIAISTHFKCQFSLLLQQSKL